MFIDCNRNAYAQTAVAPYAIRAYESAPIACPISWNEVKDSQLTPQRYTIHHLPHLQQAENPWATLAKSAQSITQLFKK